MSINSRDIDSYIEHRRDSYGKYDVPVRKKVSRPERKDIFADSADVPERKPFSFFGLFEKKDDYPEPEDDYEEMVSASKGKKTDFSDKDHVDVKFDSNGNIIGPRHSAVPVKAARSVNAVSVQPQKKKGLFSGLFAKSEPDDDDEDFSPRKSSGNPDDVRSVLSSIDNILARLSPAGLETIKKSKDYAVIDSIRKKYSFQEAVFAHQGHSPVSSASLRESSVPSSNPNDKVRQDLRKTMGISSGRSFDSSEARNR